MNSNSTIDQAITICLEDFHGTIVPIDVNTYLFVDFEYLILDIQLPSLYLFRIAGYLEKCRP